MGDVVDLADVARHGGDAGLGGELLALDLVAHGLDGLGVRTDEHDAFVGQALGEASVLGEEAEARVQGLGAGRAAGGDDLVGDQIALGGGRAADEHALVRHLDSHRVGVGLGVDDDRGDAHPAAGLDDANRDLAAVGDQDFREH